MDNHPQARIGISVFISNLTKISAKWITDVNLKDKVTSRSEENVREFFYMQGQTKSFDNKNTIVKRKTDILDFIKK